VANLLRLPYKAAKVGTAEFVSRVFPAAKKKISILNGVPAHHGYLLADTVVDPGYEADLIRGITSTVGLGDRVTVIGGGYGVSSVYARRCAGDEGSVTVIEASRPHCRFTRKTLEYNGFTDVSVMPGLVGDPVNVYSDDIAPTVDELPDADVLVMDCEGGEIPVLEELAAPYPGWIVVEAHPQFDVPMAAVEDRLDTHQYTVVKRFTDHEPIAVARR
jgi:protein-L-isoaspartate O-methyltransferase